MRKSRNGLRPVLVKSDLGEVIKGYLLKIGQEGSIEDGINQVALIEEENGFVSQWNAYNIKFDDIEETIHEDIPEEILEDYQKIKFSFTDEFGNHWTFTRKCRYDTIN